MQNNPKLGLAREYFFFPLIASQREKLCAQGIPRTRKGWVRVEEQGGVQVLSCSRLPDLWPCESWQALGRPPAHSLGCAREGLRPGALHSLGGGTSGLPAALEWG